MYEELIAKCGADVQIIKAVEEMAELSKELINLILKNDDSGVAEEIADVEIMLEQLKEICANAEEVARIKTYKILRTEERFGVRIGGKNDNQQLEGVRPSKKR